MLRFIITAEGWTKKEIGKLILQKKQGTIYFS
jgi:hypothetical protein